jgi:hypothetical protein
MVKDYSKGKVYKIVCRITGQIYFGSTCVILLSQRLRQHTYACNDFLTGKRKSKTSSYKIIVGGDYYIELIENYSCRSKDELIKREREFYDLYDCINTIRPYVYDNEIIEEHREYSRVWYLENKESVIERAKIHYENNKEKVLERRKTQYEENKDAIKENRILNKEVLSAKSKIYRDANRDRINVLKLANYHKNKKNKGTSDTPTI